MKKEQKEQVVDELTARLKAADTLLVADYRGLTMPQIDDLRTKLIASGAKFTVDKNTLTRRAAEAAGADALLALLDGPTAIAFLEADGDMVAAAKALADSAKETKVLEIRGGVMYGRAMTADEVESLATLPPADVLRGQVLGAIIAPLSALRRAAQRSAAEPRRADRRPHRAARGRRRPQPRGRGGSRAAEAPSAEAGSSRRRGRAGRRAAEEPAAEARTSAEEPQQAEAPEPAAETEEENANGC